MDRWNFTDPTRGHSRNKYDFCFTPIELSLILHQSGVHEIGVYKQKSSKPSNCNTKINAKTTFESIRCNQIVNSNVKLIMFRNLLKEMGKSIDPSKPIHGKCAIYLYIYIYTFQLVHYTACIQNSEIYISSYTSYIYIYTPIYMYCLYVCIEFQVFCLTFPDFPMFSNVEVCCR